MKARTAWPVFLFVLLMALAATGDAGKMMSVQVKKGDMRATPQFLGKIVSTLSYGDRVEVLESRESWLRVAPSGKNVTGWMHSSALSEKRIVLKARNRNLDFSWIDRMQATQLPPERLAAFLRDGGLPSGEGDAR
jgi:SH3-like domain-containing protein